MKRERKIYAPVFKTKAVELSNERTNISEMAQRIWRVWVRQVPRQWKFKTNTRKGKDS